MSISDTQICNLALLHVGAGRITSLGDDASEEGIVCNILYQPTVDEVLASAPWSCAIARRSLAQRSEDIVGEDYSYSYQLPSDPYCLTPLEMIGAESEEFKVEGRILYTNQSEVDLRFIKRITDPSQFDPLLVKAIAYRLAADLAVTLSHSLNNRAAMIVMYEQQRKRAIAIDSQRRGKEKDTALFINSGR